MLRRILAWLSPHLPSDKNLSIDDTTNETNPAIGHVLHLLTADEHSSPIPSRLEYLYEYKTIEKPIGPRLADGSINWQCDCMGGGSMVAHRCGFYFRNMYKCMSQVDDKEDVNMKCPEEFIDWAACIQRMCGAERLRFRERLLNEDFMKDKENLTNEKDVVSNE
uniref:CHCH domain-containing protein n=1 Tax=Ascaris lumbricoides TaxID=6252 RepID=A0A0M3IP55_ASCLU